MLIVKLSSTVELLYSGSQIVDSAALLICSILGLLKHLTANYWAPKAKT